MNKTSDGMSRRAPPQVEGRIPGIEFVDKNVQLAGEFLRDTISSANRQAGARS
jgi:hypothetical protein